MRRETALVIPVSGLPAVIEDLRLRHDPSAAAGVPAHVTILYPFIEPEQVDAERLVELEDLFAGFAPFEYSLVALRSFDDGTVYLAPEPERSFIAICDTLSTRFGVAPYGGAYREVVPHLTVALAADQETRMQIEVTVAYLLPLQVLAGEAWLLVGSTDTRWTRWRSFELGRSRPRLRSAEPAG